MSHRRSLQDPGPGRGGSRFPGHWWPLHSVPCLPPALVIGDLLLKAPGSEGRENEGGHLFIHQLPCTFFFALIFPMQFSKFNFYLY